MVSAYISLLALGLAITKIAAQYLFQLSAKKYNLVYDIIGVLCYTVFGYLLKEIIVTTNSLAMAAVISIVSSIILVIIGSVVFKQSHTRTQWIGIVAVMIGGYLAI